MAGISVLKIGLACAKIPAPIARNLASPAQQRCRNSRAASTSAETYYSSQSGRMMRVPGSAGIRIHENSPKGWQSNGRKLDLLRDLCSARPDSVLLWPSAVTELRKNFDVPALKPTKLCLAIDQMSDLEKALENKDVIDMVCVYTGCDAAFDLNSSLDLIKNAKSGGLEVRAYLQDSFEADAAIVQDAIVALADADTDVIVVADLEEKADPDLLRDVVEAALWLDVVGESMLERLALRASLARCMEAMELGVTRFDACLAPKVRFSSGVVCNDSPT